LPCRPSTHMARKGQHPQEQSRPSQEPFECASAHQWRAESIQPPQKAGPMTRLFCGLMFGNPLINSSHISESPLPLERDREREMNLLQRFPLTQPSPKGRGSSSLVPQDKRRASRLLCTTATPDCPGVSTPTRRHNPAGLPICRWVGPEYGALRRHL